MLRGFQPVPCLRQRGSPGYRPMVGQQQGIIVPYIGRDGIRDSLGTRRFVVNAGNGPQVHQRLRIDGPVQAHPRDGEGCRYRRVRVTDCHRVASFLIDPQMHLHFAGGTLLPLADHGSVQPHLDHLILGHETLRHAGRRRHDGVLIHFAGDVAVVGCDEILHIHAPSDLHDHLPGFGVSRVPFQFIHHGFIPRLRFELLTVRSQFATCVL